MRSTATPDIRDYSALRSGGASPHSARVQLRLEEAQAQRFESIVRARAARGGGDGPAPRFARHDRHVAAVMAQGGFPALTEKADAGGCRTVSLPLIWPAPAEAPTRGIRR